MLVSLNSGSLNSSETIPGCVCVFGVCGGWERERHSEGVLESSIGLAGGCVGEMVDGWTVEGMGGG